MNEFPLYVFSLAKKLQGSYDANTAKIIFILLTICNLARKKGLLELKQTLTRKWMFEPLASVITMIIEDETEEELSYQVPEKIRKVQEKEILQNNYTGRWLLKHLLVLEGMDFILEGANPKRLFELLATFVGEENYFTLKKDIAALQKKSSR